MAFSSRRGEGKRRQGSGHVEQDETRSLLSSGDYKKHSKHSSDIQSAMDADQSVFLLQNNETSLLRRANTSVTRGSTLKTGTGNAALQRSHASIDGGSSRRGLEELFSRVDLIPEIQAEIFEEEDVKELENMPAIDGPPITTAASLVRQPTPQLQYCPTLQDAIAEAERVDRDFQQHSDILCLEWRNLGFQVEKAGMILNNCYGKLHPGEVTALIGPSGAGKSTLMNLLAARQRWTGGGVQLSGEIRYGGKLVGYEQLKQSISFVMQYEELVGSETVLETFQFAAKLKLPNATEEERKKNIEEMLVALDLDHVRDAKIGNALIKGISGGQRKRVAVGIELLTRPTVVFLDEPTSGLDSYSSLRLITMLKKIAYDQNSIIAATIHQPSSELFAKFDRVITMRYGEILFQGMIGARAEEQLKKIDEKQQITSSEGGVATSVANARVGVEKLHVLTEFLDNIAQKPCPAGYNLSDWLMILASGHLSDEELRENREQTARIYEMLNPGYTDVRRPLIQAFGEDGQEGVGQEVVDLEANLDVVASTTRVTGIRFGGPTLGPGKFREDEQSSLYSSAQDPTFEPVPVLNHGTLALSQIKCNKTAGVTPNCLKVIHTRFPHKQAQQQAAADAFRMVEVPPWCAQVAALTSRNCRVKWRNPWGIVNRLLVPLAQIMAQGLAFINCGRQLEQGQDPDGNPLQTASAFTQKLGEVNNALCNILFVVFIATGIAQLTDLPKERPIFLREYIARYYGASAYMTAQIVADLPLLALTVLIVLLGPYFLFGLNGNLGIYVFLSAITALAGSSMGVFLSTLSPANANIPVVWSPLIMSTLPNVFSGIFRPLSQVPAAVSWLAYAIPVMYTAKVGQWLEFGELEPEITRTNPAAQAGWAEARDSFISPRGIYAYQVWTWPFFALGLAVFYRVAGFTFLKLNSRSVF
ncbi:unnamed protein product [Amoebophrya sp. A120]|nr:unnamed protein product [Amoebophrya sp. A120]|eukprot:GSA120T00025257001.1